MLVIFITCDSSGVTFSIIRSSKASLPFDKLRQSESWNNLRKLLVFDSLCSLFKHIEKAVSNSADAPETTFQFETILVGKKDSQ